MSIPLLVLAVFMGALPLYAQESDRMPVRNEAIPPPEATTEQAAKQTPVLSARTLQQSAMSSAMAPASTNVLVNNNGGISGASRFTQSETSILAFGNTVVVGFNDAGSISAGDHFTGWAYSTDGGATFTDGGVLPVHPTGDVGDPVLARNNTTGRIYFATLGFNAPGTIQLFRSDDNGVTWMAPVNATPGGSDEDKQWMAVDNYAGTGNGNVYLLSRRFAGTQGMYFFRSTDHGATFGPAGGTPIALPAVQGAFIAVGPDHSIYVFYLIPGTIQMRRSTDFGASFSAPVTVVSGLSTLTNNGDLGLTGIRQGTATPASFRSNSFPHAAVNPVNGHVYVTYNNNPAGADKADVFMVRSANKGLNWSAPQRVNDDATITDQWQPTIGVTDDGKYLGIFYYSRQEDPANNNLYKFYGRLGAITGSGTLTLGTSFPISDVASFPEFGRDITNPFYMGDYDQAATTPGLFHVSWADNRDDLPGGAPRKDPNVYYSRITIDNELPVITCNPDITSATDAGLCTKALTVAPATATDNSGIVSVSGKRNDGKQLNQPYPFGETLITWTATDGTGNQATCTQKVIINQITTTTSVTVTPTSQQYSDLVNLKATVIPFDCGGAGLVGGTVTFKIGTQTVGTATVQADGTATLNNVALLEPTPFGTAPTGQMAPGIRTVTVGFSTTDADYLVNAATTPLKITEEDATVSYNGQQYFTTNHPDNCQGTISLSAYIQDIVDASRGVIRNATITFRNGISGSPISASTTNRPVGLIDPANEQEGIATADYLHTLSGSDCSAGGKTWDVWVTAHAYYAAKAIDVVPVTLALPGSDFVTGGGYTIMAQSAGKYAATDDSKMNFGFNMKWNKSGKNLQGQINIVFRRYELVGTDWVWRIYQIKSNSINSMAVKEETGYRRAIVSTKANLKRLYPDGTFDDLGGNLSLGLDVWESTAVNDGSLDKIAVTLTGSAGLLFSSNWPSTKTVEQYINSGKIQVRNNFPPSTEPVTRVSADASTTNQVVGLNLSAWPNPSTHAFTVDIQADTRAVVQLKVFDINGRQVYGARDASSRRFTFGEKFTTGVYLIEVWQGSKRSALKVVKQ